MKTSRVARVVVVLLIGLALVAGKGGPRVGPVEAAPAKQMVELKFGL